MMENRSLGRLNIEVYGLIKRENLESSLKTFFNHTKDHIVIKHQ